MADKKNGIKRGDVDPRLLCELALLMDNVRVKGAAIGLTSEQINNTIHNVFVLTRRGELVPEDEASLVKLADTRL